MSRRLTLSVIAIVLASSGLVWYFYFVPKLVASGEKFDEFVYVRYGYELEQYRFEPKMRFTLWHSRGMRLRYELDWSTIERVIEERWLPRNRAIYIRLNIISHDSEGKRIRPTKIIYDFERGELYTQSNHMLWRLLFCREPHCGHYLTEEEFNSILSQLEKQ